MRPSRTNTKKDVLFIIGDMNEKVGSQEIPEITGKVFLGAQNEAGQSLSFLQKTLFSNNTSNDSSNTHHQIVNTQLRLITLFAAKDVDAL